jgi:hypothetical protein
VVYEHSTPEVVGVHWSLSLSLYRDAYAQYYDAETKRNVTPNDTAVKNVKHIER